MIKTVIATLAGMLIAAASPAAIRADAPVAAPPIAAADTTNAGTEAPASVKPATAKRYCVEGTVTGSRLRKRDCQTREDWLAQGFDPLKK